MIGYQFDYFQMLDCYLIKSNLKILAYIWTIYSVPCLLL